MLRELDALGFAAGERGGGLAEADVAEADLVEHGELVDDLRVAGEEVEGFAYGHVEHVVDVFALVLHFEDGGLVARGVALFAGELDVSEELHLDGDGAVAFADIAAAAGDVEAEAAGGEVLAAGVGLRGEELADGVEGLDVGDGVGARRAANGRLVDEHDVVEEVRAGELAEGVGDVAAVTLAERLQQRAVEHLMHERGFAGAGDAGDAARAGRGEFRHRRRGGCGCVRL